MRSCRWDSQHCPFVNEKVRIVVWKIVNDHRRLAASRLHDTHRRAICLRDGYCAVGRTIVERHFLVWNRRYHHHTCPQAKLVDQLTDSEGVIWKEISHVLGEDQSCFRQCSYHEGHSSNDSLDIGVWTKKARAKYDEITLFQTKPTPKLLCVAPSKALKVHPAQHHLTWGATPNVGFHELLKITGPTRD